LLIGVSRHRYSLTLGRLRQGAGMNILPRRLRPARRDDPKRIRQGAATRSGVRSETMSSGRARFRTTECRDKVGNLRRGGRSRERSVTSPDLDASKGSCPIDPADPCRRDGSDLQAHGSCPPSNGGRGSGIMSLESGKPRRAASAGGLNHRRTATRSRGEQSLEGDGTRLPVVRSVYLRAWPWLRA
jgi:hypothetical protein